jgi:hypothetical protein
MLMKSSNDTSRNRTGDLPACSAVPQPPAPPRTPQKHRIDNNNNNNNNNSYVGLDICVIENFYVFRYGLFVCRQFMAAFI